MISTRRMTRYYIMHDVVHVSRKERLYPGRHVGLSSSHLQVPPGATSCVVTTLGGSTAIGELSLPSRISLQLGYFVFTICQ